MFKKKSCRNCGEKVNEKFEYCPSCGFHLATNTQSDYGMLGKSDSVEDDFQRMAKGLFGGGMIGKMMGSAVKMLEKELQRELQKQDNQKPIKTNFQLFVNGKKVDPSNIKISQGAVNHQAKPVVKKVSNMSNKRIKDISKLPRQEPETSMKRIYDKVVYELDVPGVESIDDVIISELESSIEVKAVAKDKVYSKTIPIDLPIKQYSLSKSKLTLQLDAEL